MALFFAAIRRDSVSLLRFPFLSHIHICPNEMLLVSCLKYQYSCFSSHFCFLIIFVVSGGCFPQHFSMKSLSCCIDASTLSSMLAKFHHYWNLTIRLFSVISGHSLGVGLLPFYREAVDAFYSPSQRGIWFQVAFLFSRLLLLLL